jgi:hypothetical protein
MTEPGWAGTTMVVSSVFGLERNNRSLHPLGPLSDIRRMGLPESFSGGYFGEEPVRNSKHHADIMPCTSYARVS